MVINLETVIKIYYLDTIISIKDLTIGLFRIYSRPLSTTEVSQNYQSVKSRFGL